MGKGSTFWLLSLFKRKQWLCLFAVFLLISFISSLIYTLQKNSNYTKLKLGSLSQAFYLRVSHHLENCVYELNDTTKGPIKADTRLILKYEEIREDLSHSLKLGGHFSPASCKSKHKVAVIVPFRDREVHLKIFLIHMHPFLQRQNIEYSIIIVEQMQSAFQGKYSIPQTSSCTHKRRPNSSSIMKYECDLSLLLFEL
uniref:Galactosyltransferase N-terminal domain-containing protein n=1 Tax=Biomphalaria glabrata TaxID=6526 RepID=A0A2C9KEJ0_BIOGL